MREHNVIKEHAAQIISALAAAVLAAWQAWRVLAVPPGADTAALETRIDQTAVRYPQWELEMDACYLASEQIGDRLYAAFANETDGSLWGAIFARHPFRGWEVVRMETGADLPLTSFEDFDAGRTVVIGTGADCAPVERWALCRMEDWMPVYGEALQAAPFVHVEEGLLCTLAYDAAGNERPELFDALQMHKGYQVKTHACRTGEGRRA